MKVEYTLTKTEYDNIEQMFENIPIRLCDYVECPECEGDACENCPLRSISEDWENGLSELCWSIGARLKAIKQREEK
jgi:hypothetical protein